MKRPAGSEPLLANFFAAVALVLVIIDPTRPMWLILVPLALAVGCNLVPRWIGK